MNGKEILCRGSVLPYQEFTHAERLTDGEWKSLLNSPQRPETPKWLKPIMVAE
jgi:hypothetical protein